MSKDDNTEVLSEFEKEWEVLLLPPNKDSTKAGCSLSVDLQDFDGNTITEVTTQNIANGDIALKVSGCDTQFANVGQYEVRLNEGLDLDEMIMNPQLYPVPFCEPKALSCDTSDPSNVRCWEEGMIPEYTMCEEST